MTFQGDIALLFYRAMSGGEKKYRHEMDLRSVTLDRTSSFVIVNQSSGKNEAL